MIFLDGKHPLTFRGERNLSDPFEPLDAVLGDAELPLRDQKRSLGGVALDPPLTVPLLQVGVAGQAAAAKHRDVLFMLWTTTMLGDNDAVRGVSNPGDPSLARGRDDPLDRISDLVSVPVLSEAITDAEPSVSTDDSFLTIARCLAIRCTPNAKTTDKIAARPSGTAATASETPSSKIVVASAAVRTSEIMNTVTTTTTAMIRTALPGIRPIRPTSICSGVGSSWVSSNMPAVEPISVAIPVAVTMARPVPWATAVPLKTVHRRSPSAAGPATPRRPFPLPRSPR
jgi:hypothetical protein